VLFDRLAGFVPGPVLRGERVTLRLPLLRDHAAWASLRLQSRGFLERWEPPWPPDALDRASFRRRVRRGQDEARLATAYAFLIFRREDDALLGGIALSDVRRGIAQSGDIGYWTGAPFAAQGYMTDALRTVVDFAFEDLRLNRVAAACLPENAPSRAVLSKAGFREEGVARAYLNINGRFADHVLFGVLAADPRPWRHNGHSPAGLVKPGVSIGP